MIRHFAPSLARYQLILTITLFPWRPLQNTSYTAMLQKAKILLLGPSEVGFTI